ncbi:hypothetical protein [Asticcacaulis tiandongensis]|uniref:hypothetical protein n=1 Tax=Asticcacaulis tiandongensis TaxID=2565365 RepID=UPI001127C14F|nr:hypothetical protein [Asticcacaulis tiandongensis]
MKQKSGHIQWIGGVALALGLHVLALVVVALSTVKPLPMRFEPVEIELWHIPQTQSPAPPKTETEPAPRTDRPAPPPTPDPASPRPARAVQTDDILPIAPKPAPDAPPESAPDTAHAVTPKAYDAGGNRRRAALTQGLLKREACLEQRRLGKPLDKDCALGEAPEDLTLPLKPRETRPTQLCLAERERTWQKYREGRAAYPGIKDALKGNKDCRKDWD